jgi:hypothetical protein
MPNPVERCLSRGPLCGPISSTVQRIWLSLGAVTLD